MSLDESQLELAALDWFSQLGFHTLRTGRIWTGRSTQERDSIRRRSVGSQRLQAAIARLNPGIPSEGLE